MMAIVMLLVLASTAFADEYTPVDWIQVAEGGGVAVTFETPVIWGDYPYTYWRRGFEIEAEDGCFKVYRTCDIGTVVDPGYPCGFAGENGTFLFRVEDDGTGCLYTPGPGAICSGGSMRYNDVLVINTGNYWQIAELPGEPLNNVTIRNSKWQEGPEWTDVPGTDQGFGLICSADLSDGNYRWVAEIKIEDVEEKYASGNTIGEILTAVQNLTWGLLKSKSKR